MQHPIPDKFEDLSPTQVEEFARIGFAFFCSLRTHAEKQAEFNALHQKFTEQHQDLIKSINSTVTKIKR